MRLAERDAAVHELRGSRHDEETGLVLFELGPLVGFASVLDREGVQAELGLHLVEQFGAGFVQADPDDMAGAAGPFAGFGKPHMGHATTIDVGAGRNHAEVLIGRSNSVCLSHSDTLV